MKEGAARFLARVPLVSLALGCCLGILCAGWALPWLILPGVGLLVSARMGRWMVTAGFAGWLLLWSVHHDRLQRQSDGETWIHANGRTRVEVEGAVISLRDRGGFLPRAVFRISANERNPRGLRRTLVGVGDLPNEVKPGDVLLLRGQTFFPAAARNPAEFDRMNWIRNHGLAGEIRADSHEVMARPRMSLLLQRLAWDLRSELRTRIVAGLGEEEAGAILIRGLVLGDRSEGAEFYGAFRKSGTMHIFAVSGLHVGLVGALAWMLMRFFRVPRGWGLWAVFVIMWGYAFVTGLRPPAVRAAFMASVFLVGFAVRRQPSLPNSLLASLPAVLLMDSYQLGQVGFQLSYVVVGMIILATPFFSRRLQAVTEGDPFLPRLLYTRGQRWSLALRKYVAGLLVVSLAAWLGSMPLIGYHFGIVTPAAVLASMLLVPLVFLILSVALVGVVMGLVAEPLQVGANRFNSLLAEGAYRIAQEVTEIPGSYFELHGQGGWSEGMLVFDLWDGDGAIYVGAGGGVLIDGGAQDQFRRMVKPALEDAGAIPQSLVLTHPETGHAGGLALALPLYMPRQVLLPVEEAASPAFRELVRVAGESGCGVHIGIAGRWYPLGDGAELEILRLADREHGSRADDRCMVMRLHWRGWRVLITGDAGFDTEKEMLESGVDLSCDLWVMGRHRSDFSGIMEFVQAVNPSVIVAEEDRYPLSERVPERWAKAVTEAGIVLWRQGETGAVMMEFRKGELELRSFRNPSKRMILRK
ncbi:MAG: ComEC/Rec2 family competence protein [Roseibacillus sp.]|nr:ComEC/Rec2 family competence protein [Roseibacillus sp.]